MTMMNILVAGATGTTGRKIMQGLVAQGHTTTALVRESSDTEGLPAETQFREGDLTDLKPDVCEGMDAVIFAAGSGGSTGPEMTDKVDRDGAKRLIDLARTEGVGKFVMLSSIGADQEDPQGDLAHYLEAKHEADEHLRASGLTYAILRPVALTDDGRSAHVSVRDEVDPTATASRADVAQLLVEAATSNRFDNQILEMQSD